MKVKASYIIMLMSVFLVGVFLDQNRTPVPIKIIFGKPFHLELTSIIIFSMVVAVLMTVGVFYLVSRRKVKQ
ncbi:MAG: hypothetical protein ACOYOS_17840 [Syntrophales bacterium]